MISGVLLTLVRGPVRGHMVKAATRGECDTGVESILLNQLPHAAFQSLTELYHGDTRLGYSPHVISNLLNIANSYGER